MSMNTPGYQDELEKNIMYNWKQPKKKKNYQDKNEAIKIIMIILLLTLLLFLYLSLVTIAFSYKLKYQGLYLSNVILAKRRPQRKVRLKKKQ